MRRPRPARCGCSAASPCAEHKAFYDGFKVKPVQPKSLEIGDRVYLRGDHPHAGESGTIVAVKRTIAGVGLEIKIENCQHGTDGCFVFKAEHLEHLGRERRGGAR